MSRQSCHGRAGYTLLRCRDGDRAECPNIIAHAKDNESGRMDWLGILEEYLLIHAASSWDSTWREYAGWFRRIVAGSFSGIAMAGSLSLLSACASSPRVDAGVEQPARAENSVSTDATPQVKTPKARTASSPPAASNTSSSRLSEPRLMPDMAVYFSSSSFELSAEGLQTVRSFADRLNGNRRLVVTLIGSTDGLGSKEMCVAIANKRNAAVEDKLLDFGVKRQQIRKYARGCEAGADLSCTSDSCRKQYRRVEMQIDNS